MCVFLTLLFTIVLDKKKKKMTLQHFTDCLNEIIEYLEGDEISLRSCLLVSRLWCKISVRILWRNVLKATPIYAYSVSYPKHKQLSIISTLIDRKSVV